MDYKIVRPEEATTLDHPFGKILELFTIDDHPDVNIALAQISNDKMHHHKK